MKTTSLLLCIVAFVFAGCATPTSRLNRISVGMTKEQVTAVLGQPVSTAAQGKGEVFRYELSTPEQIMWTGGSDEYYVRFVGGRVESFGRMGDYDSTKDPTIRIESDSRSQTDVTVKKDADLYTELKKLKELLDEKIITQEEFDARKKKLMEAK